MKKLFKKIILITAISLLPMGNAEATSHHFNITGGYTMDINTTGTWSTSIDTDTGGLNNTLDINFGITTNDPNPITCMDLTATTTNASSTQSEALKSADFTPGLTSTSPLVIFGNSADCPTNSAIQDCCGSSSASNNPEAISYAGTLTIDNGGSFTYSETGTRHFDLTVDPTVQGNATNLHYTLSSSCCANTYDCNLGNDADGTYEVELCLTGIPSI